MSTRKVTLAISVEVPTTMSEATVARLVQRLLETGEVVEPKNELETHNLRNDPDRDLFASMGKVWVIK